MCIRDRQRTGVKLDVLSNSEQRFLDYKSIASRGGFEKIIEKGTLVLDIGGGSIQMSLFDKEMCIRDRITAAAAGNVVCRAAGRTESHHGSLLTKDGEDTAFFLIL